MSSGKPVWYLYVLTCRDGSFYCGITTDVERRLKQHNAGTGARYTRARLPVRLEKAWLCGDHSAALKGESAFKRLTRSAKEKRLNHQVPNFSADTIVPQKQG